jgi:3-methyladenine DNA glycosylase AlkD
MEIKDLFMQELQNAGNPEKAKGAAWFFQTEPGGYGEGDVFLGLTVPAQRIISRKYYKLLTPEELADLLRHEVHEVRLCALMTLVLQYQKSKTEQDKEKIVEIYRANLDYVNNWDLVDSSAHLILGDWCLHHGYSELAELARSGHLWRQRVAMISTYAFLRAGQHQPALEMAEILLQHKHDLIHKAVGWMLREVGNRDYQAEYAFLVKHYPTMPRTMLRYAIEKFDEELRQDFLKGRI